MSGTKIQIYFYSPEASNIPKNHAEAIDPKFYSSGLHHWLHYTYCYFKYIDHDHAFDVVITDQIPDQGIIVFHRGWFPADLKPNRRQFFVCLLVDYGRHRFAQIQVIHNPRSANNYRRSIKSLLDKCFPFVKEIFVPSWPQPGLIPRSPVRGHRIDNVCFMGHAKNLPKELRAEDWRRRCEAMNVNFQIVSESSKWADFSQIDLILAMRSFDKRPYYHKPFLKITNALFAGVPVIATGESSHLYLKNVDKVDFPIVDSSSQLENVIMSMKKNPIAEFQRVEANLQRIKGYNAEAVMQTYKKLFQECDVMRRRWSNAPIIVRFFYIGLRALRFSLK